MALTRRHLGALLVAGALPGCSALTNDAIELSIENRSATKRHVVAYVYPPGEDRGVPVRDVHLPTGSKAIEGDVTGAPMDGSKRVTVTLVLDGSEVTETVTVTGPGTIAAMLTRSGVDVEFGRRD